MPANKLDIYQFGRELLETKDLDPVYVLIHEAKLKQWELERWLLAYWCFYHVGTASWIADGDIGYWKRMETAAGSKDYPRSSERRHFRGENAKKSVAWLKAKGLLGLLDPLTRYKGHTHTAEAVMEYIQTWVGFGPWIAFKVADMLERLGIADVKFSNADALYESPLEGAKMLCEVEHGARSDGRLGVGEWAISSILSEINAQAPPRYERNINAQEAETILCKWLSYVKGHYYVGKDIKEVKQGLMRFAKCRLTQRLLKAGKLGGLW